MDAGDVGTTALGVILVLGIPAGMVALSVGALRALRSFAQTSLVAPGLYDWWLAGPRRRLTLRIGAWGNLAMVGLLAATACIGLLRSVA